MFKNYLKSLINSCLVGVLAINMAASADLTDLLDNLLDKISPFSLASERIKKEGKLVTVVATGYSSTPDQTDSTPFHTASGIEVYDGIVAANFLDFKTRIKIPKLFGDKIFTVEDRMNSRYNNRMPHRLDVWFSNRALAKKFGIQKVEIIVLE
jgi:3D (Asp-Asp-Asp) domain-containing protein